MQRMMMSRLILAIGWFGCVLEFAAVSTALADEDTTRAPVRTAREPGRWVNTSLTPRWIDETTLEFDRVGKDGGFQRVKVNAETGELTTIDSKTISTLSTAPGPAPPSTNGGGRVSVKFTNRSGADVRMQWVNAGDRRVDYGQLKRGETRVQSTFIGHSWEFRPVTDDDEAGKQLSHAVPLGPGSIEIGEFTSFQAPTKSIPSRPSLPALTSGERVGSTLANDAEQGFVFRNGDLVWKENRESNGRVIRPPSDQLGDQANAFKMRGAPVFNGDRSRVLVWWVHDRPAPVTRWLDHSARAATGSTEPFRAQWSQRGYYLPGDPMPIYQLGILNAGTGDWIDCELEAIDFGRPRLRFRDEHRVVVQRVDRGHQRFRLFEVDTRDGSCRTVIDETTSTFIWTNHGPAVRLITEIGNSKEVLHASEESGYRHLYRVNLDEGSREAISHGDWLVREIVHIDEELKFVDVYAGGFHPNQDPYHRHLVRLDLNRGEPIAITEGDGDHRVTYSPDRRWVVDSYSRVDRPPTHELRRAVDGKLIAHLADATWVGDDAPPPLPLRFTAKGRDGETDIWGIVCGPRGFESADAKSFPVLESIYAGPHGAFVPKRFQTGPWHRELIEAGFVVVQIDGMGTAHRSKAFHDACWKNLADSGFPDRIAWMRAAANAIPSLDLDRVGVFGTSAGGQSAASAVLRFGDFYNAGSASCGCHDNRMDKASWNEQWMGYPVDESYARNSNIDAAPSLQGHLQLFVGDVDTNVPPESTFRLVDALIQADKRFDLLVLPGVGHTDGGRYGRKRLIEFMSEKLAPTPPSKLSNPLRNEDTE